MKIESLAFYVEHWTADDGTGEYVGLCPEFPSMSWFAPRPSLALEGIKHLALVEADHINRYGARIDGT